MKIWLKLAGALALLSTTVLALVVFAAIASAQHAAAEKFRSDLPRAVDRFNLQVKSANEQLALTLELIFSGEHHGLFMKARSSDGDLGLADPADAELALTEAHESFVSADLLLLKGTPDRAAKDVVVIVNNSGRLIYTLADEKQFGANLEGIAVVKAALAGREVGALWKADNADLPSPLVSAGPGEDLVLVVAQPIQRGGQILGAVLSGDRVRGSLLKNIPVEDGFLALEADGRIVAIESSSELSAAMPRLSAHQPLRLGARPIEYASASLPGISTSTGKPARLFLMRDLDQSVQTFVASFLRTVLPVAAGLLAAVLAVALVAARRMTRPLVELDLAARQVREGNYTVSVAQHSNDEMGQLALSFNQMVRGLREREEIKGLFKRYLPPQVVEELILHPEKAAPGGERRTLSVLFADLVGFTVFSEALEPEALLDLLNEHFDAATQAVGARGGTVDKFIGDAVMAYWNAPLLQEDHAARACLATLDLLDAVDRTSGLFQSRGLPRIDCRIGLNTGSCIVGVVGSSAVQDYTVIGDSVNLASRLEGAAKVYGTRSLVSEATVAAAGQAVVTRELDVLRVKGKLQAVRVYELVARAGESVPSHVHAYAEALQLYRGNHFQEARALLERHPADAPSRYLAERCARYANQPPPAEWDGVFVLESK